MLIIKKNHCICDDTLTYSYYALDYSLLQTKQNKQTNLPGLDLSKIGQKGHRKNRSRCDFCHSLVLSDHTGEGFPAGSPGCSGPYPCPLCRGVEQSALPVTGNETRAYEAYAGSQTLHDCITQVSIDLDFQSLMQNVANAHGCIII